MRTKGREAAMEQGRCKIKPKVIYSILTFISLLISNRMSWRLSADVCLFIFLLNPLKKKKVLHQWSIKMIASLLIEFILQN